MRLLIKLRADIVTTVRRLEPETIAALARQYHPEAETDYQAAAHFGLEVMAALRALTQHGEDVRHLSKAEHDRLAPLVAQAARRYLEIPRKLEGVASQLHHMDAATDERRENLRKAGVKPNEIELLIGQGAKEHAARRTALNAERTSLLTEQEALARFLQTSNEQHLPAGFKVSEAIKASATLPALQEMPPLYRVAA